MTLTPSQQAREAAADYAKTRFSASRVACYRDGYHDAGPLVQTFAVFERAIRADQREKDAKIADHAAVEAGRVGELHPEDSDSRSRMFARAREAGAIAVKIRNGDPS